jgi:hypothetical protein
MGGSASTNHCSNGWNPETGELEKDFDGAPKCRRCAALRVVQAKWCACAYCQALRTAALPDQVIRFNNYSCRSSVAPTHMHNHTDTPLAKSSYVPVFASTALLQLFSSAVPLFGCPLAVFNPLHLLFVFNHARWTTTCAASTCSARTRPPRAKPSTRPRGKLPATRAALFRGALLLSPHAADIAAFL